MDRKTGCHRKPVLSETRQYGPVRRGHDMAGMTWGRFTAIPKARALIALAVTALAGAGVLIGSQPTVLAEDVPDQAEMLRLDQALTAVPSDIHTRLRLEIGRAHV